MKRFKKIFLIILLIQSSFESDDNIETKLTNNDNNPISSDEKLIQLYINDIRIQADFTKNPCDNFQHFACANIQKTDKIGYRFHKKDAFYIEDNILNDTPKTEPEQRLKDFYLSCRNERDIKQIFEQVPTLKSIGKWPTNKNFTSIDVAELMAEMAAIVEMFLIKVQIKQNLIFLEGTQPLRFENMDNITKLMEEFGASPDDAQAAVHDIFNFLDKLENIFRYFSPETITDVQFQNRNILQRKIPNFNWNAYLMKFFTSLNLKLDSFNYDLRTKNLELLEKVTGLIEKTDRKVLINYLIYKYIQFGMKHNCEEFLPYFRPILINKLWQKYMNNDDEIRHLKLLNNFEKSYIKLKDNEIMKISSTQTYDRILHKIRNRKNVIVNHTQILNNEILQKHYDSFNIIPNEIYTNQINFYHTIARDYILHGDNGKFSQLHYAFLEGLGGEIDIMANNKPLLYYFVSENVELWRTTFEEYKPWNQQQNEQYYQQQRDICSGEGFHDDTYKVDYAANKQSFFDYLQWLNDVDNNDFMLEDNTEYINGYINKKRAYFMALAQYQCIDKGMLNKMGGDKYKGADVFTFLSRLKEFSIEYGCKPGDKMHKWNFKCEIW